MERSKNLIMCMCNYDRSIEVEVPNQQCVVAYGFLWHGPKMDVKSELAFALSYPVQVSVVGFVLAFMLALVFHQCFTAGYHYPLNRLNFVLQILSSILLVIYQAVTLGVNLSELNQFSKNWPFMFPYIAYRLPRRDTWTLTQVVFFIILESLMALLAHVRSLSVSLVCLCRPIISNFSC